MIIFPCKAEGPNTAVFVACGRCDSKFTYFANTSQCAETARERACRAVGVDPFTPAGRAITPSDEAVREVFQEQAHRCAEQNGYIFEAKSGRLACGLGCKEALFRQTLDGSLPHHFDAGDGTERTRHLREGRPAPKKPESSRTFAHICTCGARLELHQSQDAAGNWTPDASALFQANGWLRVAGSDYCGKICAERHAPKPPVPGGVRDGVAVTEPIITPRALQKTALPNGYFASRPEPRAKGK